MLVFSFDLYYDARKHKIKIYTFKITKIHYKFQKFKHKPNVNQFLPFHALQSTYITVNTVHKVDNKDDDDDDDNDNNNNNNNNNLSLSTWWL